jgi:tRNA pseudouridine13 synthase
MTALHVPDPPTGEEECGMLGFATAAPGIGGKLRADAGDFVVVEEGAPPPLVEGGPVTVVRLRVRNWETNRLVHQLAKRLHVSARRVRFSGVKDKRAVTTQLLTVEAPVEQVLAVRMPDVEVLEAWPTAAHVSLGDHTSNAFEISVTRLEFPDEEVRARIDAILAELDTVGGFPNFFGVQRFGVTRPISHVVGRHLVRGDPGAACWAYLTQVGPREDEDAAAARRALGSSRDVRAALRELPPKLGHERTMLDHLLHHPDDPVGALARLPFNLQLMFVHAFQGLLFNLVLSERLRRGLPLDRPVEGDILVPLGPDGGAGRARPVPVTASNLAKATLQVGRGRALVTGLVPGTDAPVAGGEMGEVESAVLERERLSPGDFRIPHLPELSSEGLRRELLLVGVRPASAVADGRASFSFALPKGCYATTVMRELMKSPIMSY